MNYWEAQFKGHISDEIHPDDFAVALRSKLISAPSKTAFCDAALLDSLSRKPFGEWTADQIQEIAKRQNDPKFLLALSRGIEKRRKPTFNHIELAILEGWRRVNIVGQEYPGLWHWSPKAATCLFQAMGIFQTADHKSTFVDTRKALGLRQKEIIVADFNSETDAGDIQVTLKGGEKQILKRPR